MPKLKDLTGQFFGFLEVIEKDWEKSKEKGRTYWKCYCHCGCNSYVSVRTDGLTRKQGTKSCGSLISKTAKERFTKDLKGKIIGELTVLEMVPNTSPVKWLCECSCGKRVIRNSNSLLNKTTLSCGCLAKKKRAEEQKFKHYKDISEETFDWWKVLFLDKERTEKEKKAYWFCRCTKCNNIYSVLGSNLRSGQSTHCRNCLESDGEKIINQFLLSNNFSFKREFSFPNLYSVKNGKLRFDFMVYKNNLPIIAIEYQGEQHYQAVPHWGGEEALAIRKQNDQLKEQYCKDNQIKLITIPYWDKEKIEEKYLKPLLV